MGSGNSKQRPNFFGERTGGIWYGSSKAREVSESETVKVFISQIREFELYHIILTL